MSLNVKFSFILPLMGQLKDRFTVYHQPLTLAERLQRAAQVEGLAGVEMVYPAEFEDPAETQRLLRECGLECSTVNVNVKSEEKFLEGAFTSPDPAIRQEAVRYMKAAMDISADLGTLMVTVCPLSDGHDYPFEIDYRRAWRHFVECIGEAASHRSDVKVSLEYKMSEPRAHVILNSAATSLQACHDVGLPNVGVTLDLGHALYALETPAQAICMLADAGRLFLVHINDNYRNWDWDMVPGSVNFWDLIEVLLYLDELDYEGWLTSDVFPYRLDPVKCCAATIRYTRSAQRLLQTVGPDNLRRLIREGDVIDVFDFLHSHLECK